MPEAEFVRRLKAGDDSAAEELVREHSGWMLSLARRYVIDNALAEDCVQEAFLNAFRSIERFEGRSKLKSWLHRIVLNEALKTIHSRRRWDERPIEDLLPEFDKFDCRVEGLWPEIASPIEILEGNQIRVLVTEKINELPTKYRIVLLLRDIEEMSTAETAALLKITEGTVKVRLHRARSALRVLLRPVIGAETEP